jgi:hypothetical protein
VLHGTPINAIAATGRDVCCADLLSQPDKCPAWSDGILSSSFRGLSCHAGALSRSFALPLRPSATAGGFSVSIVASIGNLFFSFGGYFTSDVFPALGSDASFVPT